MPSLRRFLLRYYRIYGSYFLRHGTLLLLFLLLGDGISLLYFPRIQAALALSGYATATPPTLLSGIGVAAPPVEPGASVLASDTFQRPDRLYWGTASDGQTWQGDAGRERNFLIAAHAGLIGATPPGVFCDALLGTTHANSEIILTVAFSRADGSSQLGAVLRWSDAGNFYALVLDGQTLVLERVMDGIQTPLQSLHFPIQPALAYALRFRVLDTSLFAMVWPATQPAPVDWQIVLGDTALHSGRGGLHALIQRDVQAKITSFKEINL